VIARLVLGAVAWFAALGLFAAGLQWSGQRHPPRPFATTDLARAINAAQHMSDSAWRWSATSTKTAMRGMVVDVDALRVEDAAAIARSIVEPRQAQFDVVLVYVHRVGARKELPARRVEWSRRDGYVEISYEPAR